MIINNINFDVGYLELCHVMHENNFMKVVNQRFQNAEFLETPDGRQLIYIDNNSPILGVAHLDGTMPATHFAMGRHYSVPDDTCIFSPFVDDRLGAYTILDILPKQGLNIDILLSVGEEIGDPTSQHFKPKKMYNWMFQFDRMGQDAVHYQYTEYAWVKALEDAFTDVSWGMFSDIAFMDHLGVCGVNIGTGYHDYTTRGAWASLNQLASQVKKFEGFYHTHKDRRFNHVEERRPKRYRRAAGYRY